MALAGLAGGNRELDLAHGFRGLRRSSEVARISAAIHRAATCPRGRCCWPRSMQGSAWRGSWRSSRPCGRWPAPWAGTAWSDGSTGSPGTVRRVRCAARAGSVGLKTRPCRVSP